MKKISIWIAISICLCFVLKVRAQDITTGLVAHYEFENTSGDVIDAAGSHNGTNNGATRGVSGKVGNAFSFDGGDYITINNHSDITNYASFTLSAWVYPTALSSNKTIISKVSPNRDFDLKFLGSNIEAHFAYGSNYYRCTSTSTATINSWIHVVATWQNNQWNIYYNGVLDHTCNFTTGPPWSGGKMQIGAMANGERFVGLIDEVRIYNRALTATDAATLYSYNGIVPQLSVNDISVDEEDGTAVFTIVLDQISTIAVSGTYSTSDGTAVAGNDYIGTTNQVFNIPAGQISTTVSVPITDENEVENDETFNIEIISADNAIIDSGTGICTIIDNDEAELSCSTTITSYSYIESFENTSSTWENVTTDDRITGSIHTGAIYSGPSSAFEGDYYYYVRYNRGGGASPTLVQDETTYVYSTDYNEGWKTVVLRSPCFDLSGLSSARLSLASHMYDTWGNGNSDVIIIEVSSDGEIWEPLDTLSAGVENSWREIEVNLNPYIGRIVQCRFQWKTNDEYSSDVAIDNIRLDVEELDTNDLWALSGTNIFNTNSGNVGIGTNSPDEKLTVNGTVHSKEVIIDLGIPAPDYVFDKEYGLMTISELKTFLKENSHLPEFPSALEMEENGINLSEINMSLLKRIEELTLYILDQEKRIQEIEKQYLINNKKQ